MRLRVARAACLALVLSGCGGSGSSSPTAVRALPVAYRTSFHTGTRGWLAAGPRTWTEAARGIGSSGRGYSPSSLIAPAPAPASSDLEVQARIRFLRDFGGTRPNFGVAFRADRSLSQAIDLVVYPSLGYLSIWSDRAQRDLIRAAFHPGTGWHTYRLAASGDSYRGFVDGREVVHATYGGAPGGNRTGLFSASCVIAVVTFSVAASA